MAEESCLHSKRADGAGKLVCRAWLVVQAADQNHMLLNCPQVPFLLYFTVCWKMHNLGRSSGSLN